MRVFSSATSVMNDGWYSVVFVRTLIGAATELHSVRTLARTLPAVREVVEEIHGECTLSKQERADHAALMVWRMVARWWRNEKTLPTHHSGG
jgi:hypothetical protein